MRPETINLNGLQFALTDDGCTVAVCGLLESFSTRSEALLWIYTMVKKVAL